MVVVRIAANVGMPVVSVGCDSQQSYSQNHDTDSTRKGSIVGRSRNTVGIMVVSYGEVTDHNEYQTQQKR